MDNKFKNRYRIPSTRLENYDYSSNGYYFITICTKDRINYFGEIKNNQMLLSKVGIMVQKYWLEIPNHFSFTKLDEFIVMPNHVHGILIINRKNNNVETPNLGVSTKIDLGVSTIINQYKRICTIQIRKQGISFAWQSRFYDHIIRNEQGFNRIREYIKNNPVNWINDENNNANIIVETPNLGVSTKINLGVSTKIDLGVFIVF